MIATMDTKDVIKFCSNNGIILGYNPARWECVFAIETAKSLQTNGDLGPYTTRPMLVSVGDDTVVISHFLIGNIASSRSAKVSKFAKNKKAAASMEKPSFWEDCKKKGGDKHSNCNRCGDWSRYECTLCNTTICCPVGKGNECFNEHHKSMHHEQHEESERIATLISQDKRNNCVVCGKKASNGCSICGVNVCGSVKNGSMKCWHAHCKKAGHAHFIEQVYNGKQVGRGQGKQSKKKSKKKSK